MFNVGNILKINSLEALEKIGNGIWLRLDKEYEVLQKSKNGQILIQEVGGIYKTVLLTKEQVFAELV